MQYHLELIFYWGKCNHKPSVTKKVVVPTRKWVTGLLGSIIHMSFISSQVNLTLTYPSAIKCTT